MRKKVIGETNNVSKGIIERLEKIYDYSIPRSEVISKALIEELNDITLKLNKEIALLINRYGKIESVSVGSNDLARVPEIWHKRNENGLSGIRLVHTHPSGDSRLSQPDLSTLVNLHLDALCAIGVGDVPNFSLALLHPEEGHLTEKVSCYGPFGKKDFLAINILLLVNELEKSLLKIPHQNDAKEERALLVAVFDQKAGKWDEEDIIGELVELAKTAGLTVAQIVVQKKDKPDAAYYLGKGKLEEVMLLCQNLRIDCVVFEKNLSPSQQNNLSNLLGLKIIDKTTLILDIFAQRAKSREGKLQVELAQLNYLLPRLSGHGVEMSRLGGGVGTRGPGETKLESDRRHIRRRIDNLRRELAEVRKTRVLQRKSKERNQVPQAALIGYTNAGKSSLLNRLVDESIYAEDQLFATLDTTTRALVLPEGAKVLLTDTVGFIRDLPPQLIEAFKTTLEELRLADLLIHVVDISNSNFENQIETVLAILRDLQVVDTEMIYVFNKIDKIAELPIETLGLPKENCCYISAVNGDNIDVLLGLIDAKLGHRQERLTLRLPISRGDLLSLAYQVGKVENLTYDEAYADCVLLTNKIGIPNALKEYIIME